MDGNNQNNNNQNTQPEGNNGGSTQQNNGGTQTQQGQGTQNTQTGGQQVDAKVIQAEAVSNLFKNLGVENEDALKNIIADYNKRQDEGKTELQRATEQNGTLLKQLAEEKEARMLSDAKVAAVQMGAIPDMIDDLVVVAKSKVTKEKDITAVISEIKESQTGKAYFKQEDEEEGQKGQKGAQKAKTVTRGTVKAGENKGKSNEGDGSGEGSETHKGTYAERIFKNRQRMSEKSHYFKN